jgi:hypothetical protein
MSALTREVLVGSQFERRGEGSVRHEEALEEIRRLFARYRAQPQQAAEGTQYRDGDEQQRDADVRADRSASPASP